MHVAIDYVSAKEPVEKSARNVPSQAAKPCQLAVAQSKLTLKKRPEQKPGAA